jgi:hypothetical protein
MLLKPIPKVAAVRRVVSGVKFSKRSAVKVTPRR